MKEDILEQLVEDYLHSDGFFTQHNIKFRPSKDHPDFVSKKDSNHSDIDVVGIHPLRTGPDRIWAVSCKSWQSGFSVPSKLSQIRNNKKTAGREAWKLFRELVSPKWADAFRQTIRQITGSSEFTYVMAVTAVSGDTSHWETYPPFVASLAGNPIKILTIEKMVTAISGRLNTTVEISQLGRTLQLIRAAGAVVEWPDEAAAEHAIAAVKPQRGAERPAAALLASGVRS